MTPPAKTDFEAVISTLVRGGVEFIVVGGLAGIVHGAARATYVVDVMDSRDRENIRRVVEALRPFAPYLCGAPRGLPFTWDERAVRNGLNFTLETTIGDVDLLGEIAGGGTFKDLLSATLEVQLFWAALPRRQSGKIDPTQTRRRAAQGFGSHCGVAGVARGNASAAEQFSMMPS